MPLVGGVRPPAVAGRFYPADPEQLRAEIARHLEAAEAAPDADAPLPKAVIAPHAGYRYSGPTAARAYQALAPRRGELARVVVLGPSHRIRLDGVGLTTAKRWTTPLGEVEIDQAANESLADLPGVLEADDAHAPEHSVEVHLPFVQEVFGDVPVVPLLVGRAALPDVARVLEAIWGGDETAIVVSSDLSHYLDDEAARARDRRTAVAVMEGRVSDIGPFDACGCVPIGGMLTAAVRQGVTARLVGLSTSADTAGEPSRVVGYGSFAFLPPAPLEDAERRWLLDLTARAIDHELRTGDPYPLDDAEVPDTVRRPGSTFVTLQRGDRLLGCIGSLESRRALWRDVARNARAAAFEDPRFARLVPGELEGVTIEVSILSPLEEMAAPDIDAVTKSLRPGVDGLIVAADDKRATFLPDVWAKIPDRESFVRELVRKARWDSDWAAGARAWRYTTDVAVSDAHL